MVFSLVGAVASQEAAALSLCLDRQLYIGFMPVKREVVLGLKVTRAERRSIRRAARSYKLSVGAYLRMLHEDKEATRENV